MVTSIIAIVTAIYVWFKHRITGSKAGSILILSTVVWSIGYSLEIMNAELWAKIFWNAVRYAGSELIAITFLFYVIRFMEIRTINNTVQFLLSIPPITGIFLAFTNKYHGLIWSKVSINTINPLTPLNLDCGLGFWIITGYDYLLLLSSGFLFFWMLFRSRKLYMIRVTALLVCLLVPWMFDMLNNFKFNTFNIDLTPLLLNIVSVSIAWISPERLYRRDILTVARETIIDSIQDAILVMDRYYHLIDANIAARDLAGSESSDVLGQHLETVWPQLLKQLKLHNDEKYAVNEITLIKEGEERTFDVSISSLTDWRKNVSGKIVVLRDITEHKRYSGHLEQLVEERTRQLRNAERLATIGETAAMVGHDLRNPFQVIVSTIYFLKKKLRKILSHDVESSETREIIQMIEKIGAQTEYMNKIVSDLQDYTRPIKPQLVEVKLDQLVTKTISMIKVPESIDVSILFEDEFPTLWIDEVLMMRVFLNLFMNAVQAMPDGGRLTIRGYTMGSEVLVSVEDTGVGIPEDDIDKLFKPLFTSKPKGTGFGLPVCKRFVEIHGGDISVESKVGVGSNFTIRLPPRENNSGQELDTGARRHEVVGNQ